MPPFAEVPKFIAEVLKRCRGQGQYLLAQNLCEVDSVFVVTVETSNRMNTF